MRVDMVKAQKQFLLLGILYMRNVTFNPILAIVTIS